MDHVSPETRSKIMRTVHSKGSAPEMTVRRLVHSLGYRYRLHAKQLPGSPDLVFGTRRKVIFVNGCFWHGHRSCPKARLPKSRRDYWREKIAANRARDARNLWELSELGWRPWVIWQCQVSDIEKLQDTIIDFLEGGLNE